MSPTVREGELLLIEGVPITELRRGDLIVFKAPGAGLQKLDRLIALPGETVEIRDGKVLIDGKPLEEPYIQ